VQQGLGEDAVFFDGLDDALEGDDVDVAGGVEESAADGSRLEFGGDVHDQDVAFERLIADVQGGSLEAIADFEAGQVVSEREG